MPALVVPCDPLDPRRADGHFVAEHDAARRAGWSVGLIDHDAVVAGRAGRALARLAEHARPVLYRGWMVSATAYADLHLACAERGVRLLVSPEQYRAAHELPGWTGMAEGLCADTVYAPGHDLDLLDTLAFRLGRGPAVLRDYVKSAKHDWQAAVFVPDVSDRVGLRRIADRFAELRDDEFTGGFVLRRFERYPGAEVRTWWRDGRLALTGAHPDTPDAEPPDDFTVPDRLPVAIRRLGCPFVSADLARRDDGVWRLIEIGDGQVSDRPASLPAETFLAGLEPHSQ